MCLFNRWICKIKVDYFNPKPIGRDDLLHHQSMKKKVKKYHRTYWKKLCFLLFMCTANIESYYLRFTFKVIFFNGVTNLILVIMQYGLMCVYPYNSYIEALTPSVAVFGDGTLMK